MGAQRRVLGEGEGRGVRPERGEGGGAEPVTPERAGTSAYPERTLAAGCDESGLRPRLGPTRPARRECQVRGRRESGPRQGRDSPKFAVEPLTVRLPLGRDACKRTPLGTPSRRTPLDTRILPRRVARAAAILEVAAIPDADARGRARVAAQRWVREQRPGRNADSAPAVGGVGAAGPALAAGLMPRKRMLRALFISRRGCT